MNNMKNIMGKYMDRYTKIAKKLLNKSRKVVEAPDDGGETIPSEPEPKPEPEPEVPVDPEVTPEV